MFKRLAKGPDPVSVNNNSVKIGVKKYPLNIWCAGIRTHNRLISSILLKTT